MKTMAIEELPRHVRELENATGGGRVLLTKKGKPFALVTDASNLDAEDIGYMTDESFWQMIAERRKEQGGFTLAQMKARLAAREQRERRPANGRTKSHKKGK